MRRSPVQQRSRVTVERILDAALQVLEERGVEGFSTNAVAGRAGVNIATLYSYFADKFELLTEMSDRFEQQRLRFLADRLDEFGTVPDVDEWVAETIEGLARFRAEVPAASDLRVAVASVPTLRARDHASDAAAAAHLADAIHARRPSLDRGVVDATALSFVVSGTAVLDRACAPGTVDEDMVAALVAMFRARLRELLGPETGRAGPHTADAPGART